MDFIEGRIDIEPWQLPLLASLLADLNQACRTTFSRSIRDKVDAKSLEAPWAMKAGCFVDRNGESLMLTTHQASMAVRRARGLRKAANAKSKWLANHHAKMSAECGKRIEKSLADLERLDVQIKIPSSFAKPSLKRKLRALADKKKQAVARMRARQQRLASSSKHHLDLSDAGLASMAFGGAKLATQAHQLEDESSPFKGKAQWAQAWHGARSQSWLFEGDKAAAGANKGAKMDLESGILKVRLTDRQALASMEALALSLEVDPKILAGSALKYSAQRMACRYLSLKLDWSGQASRLAGLKAALTPSTEAKHQGKTPPCEQPVSWRIGIHGDVSKPESCKVYARAMWEALDSPLATFGSNGCLGVDINAWGVALAWCDPEGNKPAKGMDWRSNIGMDWTGSSERALHEIRIAAKAIVDAAAKLGCPLGLEALDFSDLKRRLRYEASREQAKRLSGFAYRKLLEAMRARAAKVGVEIRGVDPSWTSLVGWAKYGSAFGINPDQAAAFCIARRGARSNDHMRRGKVLGGWVDVHAKAERLDGLKSKAGLAAKEPAKEIEIHEDPNPATASEQGAPAKTRKGSRRPRSMPPGKPCAERRLALALGANRKLWPQRLSLAAKERTLEGRSIPRSDPGKALEDGDTSIPAEMLKDGASQFSTD